MKTTDKKGSVTDELKAEDGSIFLRIKPTMENGVWDTGIDISLIIPDGGPLSESDQNVLLNIAFCICASVPLYEQNDGVLDMAKAILADARANNKGEYLFEDVVGGGVENAQQAEGFPNRVVKREGNVVQVLFNRTEGK
jgi:hypothetical protein